jgi:hypothetical protein
MNFMAKSSIEEKVILGQTRHEGKVVILGPVAL